MSDAYWLPAKRRGWGWGPPTAWQGKLVDVDLWKGEPPAWR